MPLVWNGSFWRLLKTRSRLFVEGDLVLAQQANALRAADAFERGGDLVGIDRVRVLALEAEQHRLVGAVAAAGHRQRAVQLGAHAGDAVEHAFLFQPVFGEARGGAHRPHRVRRRRSDADLEQVEYADGHGCTAGDAGETGYSTRHPRLWQSIRKRMSDLILYQRDYCHLCDLALAVLAEARAPDFDSVWVDDSAELEQRYGTRVPVLRDTWDGRELDWPFDAAAVRAFLATPL